MRGIARCVALVAACLAFTAAPAHALTPPIKHVWVVVLENESAGTTFGPNSPAPFLAKTLPANGALLSQYHGTAHESLGNYIALLSGQGPNPETQADCQYYHDVSPGTIGADGQALGLGCVYPSSVKTLADQLNARGLAWKGYMQDMGNDPARESATCGHPALNSMDGTQKATAKDNYATRHNPFVYFHSIIDSPLCRQRVVPLSALPGDLASAAGTPAFSFITPDLCEDGHDAPCADGRPGGLVSADGFLRTWIPMITASPAFADGGLVIVTFDEAENDDASACCGEGPGLSSPLPGITGMGGGRVGAVALSPFIRPGTVSQVPYNHYSLLRSVSAMFGVPPVGFAAAAGLAVLGDDVFTQPGGAPPGAAPLLQAATPLTGGGGRPNSGRAGGAVAGCRSASLPKARRGRFRRGSLLAAVSVRRNKRQATVTLRLNHLARVWIRWKHRKVSGRLHACRVYSVPLPRRAGRVSIEARVGGGLERRVLRIR
ncbi:MAG TPA: alkaline phosphatase family protein [Thermoleophilaceae bacterium]|nr:alkaline phosphatase family protein [Thermoleophilaceae bacterium]